MICMCVYLEIVSVLEFIHRIFKNGVYTAEFVCSMTCEDDPL